MIIPDLPWPLIVGVLAAVVVILAALAWRQPRGRSSHREHRSGRGRGRGRELGNGSGHGSGNGSDAGQKALLQAANEVRSVLDRQGREMEALRTFWSQRLDDLDRKIGTLPRVPLQAAGSPPDPRTTSDFNVYGGGTYGAGVSGVNTPGWQPAAESASWSPGPGDQPVEVRDGVLVVSRSLPPAGYLSAAGSGPARVYLNADVQLTEFSLPKWAAFFDLQGARPYAAYRTCRPAEVRWDEAMGRGELISKGTAEAI
jgi:hypothetical protein